MPLADFVRYLNAQLPDPPSAVSSPTHFVSENGEVHALYAGLRLESVFCPIVANVDGRRRGHRARLRVIDQNGQPLDPEVAYAQPRDDKEFIVLDRLVRTLHTLNYLTYRERQSLLLLKVHPRHVASVAADHGLAFEEILRSCGLMPEQITLEFDLADGHDAHLQRAIASYQSRGYSVAIGSFGNHDVDLDLLRIVRPTIVKLDQRWSTPALEQLIDQLHGLGAQVMSEVPDASALGDNLEKSGVDLLQVKTPLRALTSATELSASVDLPARAAA